jgi:hypothetical protein
MCSWCVRLYLTLADLRSQKLQLSCRSFALCPKGGERSSWAAADTRENQESRGHHWVGISRKDSKQGERAEAQEGQPGQHSSNAVRTMPSLGTGSGLREMLQASTLLPYTSSSRLTSTFALPPSLHTLRASQDRMSCAVSHTFGPWKMVGLDQALAGPGQVSHWEIQRVT